LEVHIVQFSCVVCNKAFVAQKPTAKYCSPLCSKRAQRAGLSGRRPAAAASLPPISGASDLVDAVRKTLEAAGRLDSSMGQLALVLAQKMTDHGTAAGVAG
jgi:hypothetical protein